MFIWPSPLTSSHCLVGLLRFQRFTQTNLVLREYANHVLVVLLQISDLELQHASWHTTHLDPHGLLHVPYSNVVAEQRRTSIWLGQTPFEYVGIGGENARLQWAGGWWGYGFKETKFSIGSTITNYQYELTSMCLKRYALGDGWCT